MAFPPFEKFQIIFVILCHTGRKISIFNVGAKHSHARAFKKTTLYLRKNEYFDRKSLIFKDFKGINQNNQKFLKNMLDMNIMQWYNPQRSKSFYIFLEEI